MIRMLFIAGAVLLGAGVFLIGLLSVYAPRALSTVLNPRSWHLQNLWGPRPTGRPIETIAAELRRVLADRERIVRTRSEWYVAHDLRVCERELHDLAEEAAKALDLTPCPAAIGGWTTVHLAVRLRELASAGLVLPKNAGLNGDRL